MGSIKEIENAETIVEISETKSDHPTQPQEISRIIVPKKDYSKDKPHNGKKIDRIIISQYIENDPYDPYAVTYSFEDKSILGWNIEENGQQRPHVYFKLDKSYAITSFVLYKKILVFRYDYNYNCKYLF